MLIEWLMRKLCAETVSWCTCDDTVLPDARAIPARHPAKAVNKPRVRILPGGWIRHMGGPFPFDARLPVELVMADGLLIDGRDVENAGYWHESWWRGEAHSWRRNIMFYRLVAMPRPAGAANLRGKECAGEQG